MYTLMNFYGRKNESKYFELGNESTKIHAVRKLVTCYQQLRIFHK